MSRAVHIVNDSIDPPVSGADIRNAAIDHALSDLFTTTTLVLEDLLPKRRLSATVPTVLDIADDHASAVVRRTLELAPDVVVLEGVAMLHLARLLVRMRTGHAPRIVVDMHNIESDLLAATLRMEAMALLRPFAAMRGGRMRRAVRGADAEIVALADEVWVCSGLDRDRLRALLPGGPPTHVVPNPAPGWCAAVARRTPAVGLTALFVGHLGYRPNVLAVRRLADRVWPRVTARVSGARLIVAGRRPHRSLTARAGAGRVDLLADPPDLAPLYAAATVAVLPLAIGGGTRIKALEALAAAVPMVATAMAVEGLGLEPGRHYRRAETDAEFAGAILALHREPDTRAAIARQGLAVVRERYGPDAVHHAIQQAVGLREP